MSGNEQGAIVKLLDETSVAHNEYEQRELGGVYDQLWSDWYAAYLVEHGLGGLLGETITAEKLARLLAEYDTNYRAQERQESWPDYYAAQLLEWRGTTHQQTA
jgi:hypothetical protein